jgi:hypothetical protein
MKKLLPAFALLIAPMAAFSQNAELVINGTTPVTIVESGGSAATPIYIEINNPNATSAANPGIAPVTGSLGWIISEGEFNMVKWDMGTSTGTYTVPFGYGTNAYLPVTMNIANAGAGGTGMKFSTYHTIADNASQMPTGVTNMAAYNLVNPQPSITDNSWNVVDRFWILDATSYATPPSNTGSNFATFSYIHSGSGPAEFAAPNISADETDLIAQRFNSSTNYWGDWLGQGGFVAASSWSGNVYVDQTGPLTSANMFRSWTLSNSIDPLPVNISSFTAQCDNGTAYIQWTAKSELNNNFYTVKRTLDGVHFETVGTVTGAGTTSLTQYYSFFDKSPYAGTSYYYLYQTDFDGNTTNVGTLTFNGCGDDNITASTTVSAYNTTNYIDVQVNSVGNDNFDFTLLNMLGQVIVRENHSVALGNNEFMLNNNVSPGVYILNVKNAGSTNFTKKLVIGVK